MKPQYAAWSIGMALWSGAGCLLAAALPYQSADRHLGVASCASAVCHGSVTPNASSPVRLDEYITWSHQDAHARAFQVLAGERGRAIGAKLGLASPQGARICLDCHADNVPAAQRGPRFVLADGVGCEACHGGAERWIASHAAANAGYRADVGHGMYPSATLTERAQLCDSCHVGNADKLATHRIMGAGHPRLAFELDTYLALEPAHYTIDADYRQRKPAFNHTQTWVSGQLQAALSQLNVLQDRRLLDAGVFPELALFNCSACHDSSMRRPAWRRQAMTQLTGPGMVPLNDAYWRMCWIIATALEPEQGARLLAQGQALQKAVTVNREQMGAEAQRLATMVQQLQTRSLRVPWSSAQSSKLLDTILRAGIDGDFRDYLGAEQAVMAAELLLIDAGQAARLRPQLDELYRLVKDDETYRETDFIAALRALQGRVR
jgi:hypothetical protein